MLKSSGLYPTFLSFFLQFIFPVSHYFINFAAKQESKSTNQIVKEIEEKQRVHANSRDLAHDLVTLDKIAKLLDVDYTELLRLDRKSENK